MHAATNPIAGCLPCLPCLPFPSHDLVSPTLVRPSGICPLECRLCVLAKALSGSRCRDEALCRSNFLRFLRRMRRGGGVVGEGFDGFRFIGRKMDDGRVNRKSGCRWLTPWASSHFTLPVSLPGSNNASASSSKKARFPLLMIKEQVKDYISLATGNPLPSKHILTPPTPLRAQISIAHFLVIICIKITSPLPRLRKQLQYSTTNP